MKVYIYLVFALIALSTPGCPITTCNAYDSTLKICTRNRTSGGNLYYDMYGNNVRNQYQYCPVANTYCGVFSTFINNTVLCLPTLAMGQPCFSAYQCNSGLCTLGKCSGIQGSTGNICVNNVDCEYGLSCANKICSKPLVVGAACNSPTFFDFGIGGDTNDCDYTKKALCGYTGNGTTTYKCMALFSVTNATWVSNALLCQSMITNNGWQPGYCIANRASQLPVLTYDTGVAYKKCTIDSDCSYVLNGSLPYTITGSCQCGIYDANAQSYCNYGGGEADVITAVAYYEKYWVPQYDMIFNSGAWTYQYKLDKYGRNAFNNPAYCGFQMFNQNRSVVPTTAGTVMFYSIVAALFLIGFAGVIVVFLMC